MVPHRRKAKLLGIGLDKDDDVVRVTRAEVFYLIGGSRDTHKSMQEKCIRFTQKLTERGKQLADLEQDEFLDLAAECKMNVATPRRKKKE